MKQHSLPWLKTVAVAAVLVGSAGAAAHANLVQNGDFSLTSYTANHQFGSGGSVPGPAQGVTDWTGNSGYNLYFFAGTDTTVSAIAQYVTGKEMLYGPAGGNTSPTGGNFVGLDGEQTAGVQGGISQTISGLTPGAQYELAFDWGAAQVQSRTGATTSSLQVSLGGQTFTTAVESNPSESFTGWFHQTFTFTATGASELLSFLSVGTPKGLPPMAVLDGVSLNQKVGPVPEPMSIALFGVGLLGLGGIAYRRRKA